MIMPFRRNKLSAPSQLDGGAQSLFPLLIDICAALIFRVGLAGLGYVV